MSDPFLGIYWHKFDWPTFATLATGTMAVFGAWRLGKKQIEISAKQTNITDRQAELSRSQNEILSRQTDIAEITLRHDLFQKRYEIYETVRNHITDIIAFEENVPMSRHFDIVEALRKSEFLFSSSLQQQIREVSLMTYRYRRVKSKISRTSDDDDNKEILESEEQKLISDLSDLLNLISTSFAAEMALVLKGS